MSAASYVRPPTARARARGLSLLGALVALVALGAITLAGCGSSAPRSESNPVRTNVHRGSTSVDPVARPSSGRPSVSGPTSTTGGAASVASVCRALSIDLNALGQIAGSPDNPDATRSIAQLRHLADVAPAAIKNDLRVIADFDEKLLADLRAGKSDDSIQETPALAAAHLHEARWIRANCL